MGERGTSSGSVRRWDLYDHHRASPGTYSLGQGTDPGNSPSIPEGALDAETVKPSGLARQAAYLRKDSHHSSD